MRRQFRPDAPPRQVSVGTGKDAATYELSEEHAALHGLGADEAPAGAVLRLLAEGIAVVPARGAAARGRKAARSAGAGASVGPVYRLAKGSSLAVPTGRVFLRLAEGRSAEEARAAIETAGFSIEEIPVYAPNAAWLVPKTADVAAALAALPALRALDGVEHVEPELLARKARR